MGGRPSDIKVWPLDENSEPIMERPSYHSFTVDDGIWVILRLEPGVWSAEFSPD